MNQQVDPEISLANSHWLFSQMSYTLYPRYLDTTIFYNRCSTNSTFCAKVLNSFVIMVKYSNDNGEFDSYTETGLPLNYEVIRRVAELMTSRTTITP